MPLLKKMSGYVIFSVLTTNNHGAGKIDAIHGGPQAKLLVEALPPIENRGAMKNLSGGTPMARTRIPLSAAEEETRTLREKLDLSTAEIGLTVRTTNCLEEKGIFSVRDLLNTTRSELLSINNFGEKTLEEVYSSLEKIGFCRSSTEVKPR